MQLFGCILFRFTFSAAPFVVLVMAPTRELALQIEKEVGKYNFRGQKAVCVYGGGDRRKQIENIRNGVEIVIATPGRLNDLINDKVIDVASITYLVLDEADRMLDMGFEVCSKYIFNILLSLEFAFVVIFNSHRFGNFC